MHPLGKSPVITDGRLTIAESGAIVEYLIERYGSGRLVPPAGTPERLRYTYWLHYAEGSAMPPLLLKLVFDRDRDGTDAVLRPADRARHRPQREDTFIEPQPEPPARLHGSRARATRHGSPAPSSSAADVQMSFAVEAAAARGGLDASRPKLMEFLSRIHARPAYRRALERGGAFKLG